MRIFSYVVARDYGFAPNPFHGFCTLATCMTVIRRTARVGDWVVGTGSADKRNNRGNLLVYVMRVEEIMTYNEYWDDPRFRRKRPNLRGSRKQAFGDNIYFHDGKKWCQQNSHHSCEDGKPNQRNIVHDTGTDRILVASEYAYWGGEGPEIPEKFLDYDGEDIRKKGTGHKSKFSEEFVEEFVAWFRSLDERGCLGRPLEWPGKP